MPFRVQKGQPWEIHRLKHAMLATMWALFHQLQLVTVRIPIGFRSVTVGEPLVHHGSIVNC